MADMPLRQKILLGVLVIVIGIYVYMTFLSGDGSQQPAQRNVTQASRPQTTSPQEGRQVQQTQRRDPGAVQAGVEAAPQEPVELASLSWENDPFFREKKAVAVDTSGPVDVLAGYSYTGIFDNGVKKIVTINGSWYELNDYVDSKKIIAIDKKFITLEENGITYKLFFTR